MCGWYRFHFGVHFPFLKKARALGARVATGSTRDPAATQSVGGSDACLHKPPLSCISFSTGASTSQAQDALLDAPPLSSGPLGDATANKARVVSPTGTQGDAACRGPVAA